MFNARTTTTMSNMFTMDDATPMPRIVTAGTKYGILMEKIGNNQLPKKLMKTNANNLRYTRGERIMVDKATPADTAWRQ